MRLYVNKRFISLMLIALMVFVYFSFLLGFSSNQFEKNEVFELSSKIDVISKTLAENQSFLNKLAVQFQNIVVNEKLLVSSLSPKAIQVDHKTMESHISVGVIPVVIFAYNRPSVARCIDLLLKYRSIDGFDSHFPIVVSQDANHMETTKAIESYGKKINHIKHPDENIDIPPNHRNFAGYYKIAFHYKWAITEVFRLYPLAKTLLIVEDDLEVAPDFFQYFYYSEKLLLSDTSLYCVSAWNDNGKENLIDTQATSFLHRTDFFPGLGWMLKRSLWDEIGSRWPASFWDDWFRQPSQRRNRSCIRPEVSRTRTFGRVGVSNGQFYDQYLKYIKLNDQIIDWKEFDFSKLKKNAYDKEFLANVHSLPSVSLSAIKERSVGAEVRLIYRSAASFRSYAKTIGIMDDFKSGVPRTAYYGIVSVLYNNIRVYLTPENPFKGYDETWS